jgi:hypothetical protein
MFDLSYIQQFVYRLALGKALGKKSKKNENFKIMIFIP